MGQGRLRYQAPLVRIRPVHDTTDKAAQAFIRQNVALIGTYAPFFTPFLKWFPNLHMFTWTPMRSISISRSRRSTRTGC